MPDKILVIDDHEETIRVVKFILEQQGYEVISAGSGEAGLAMAEVDKPDLILLDVMMPDMNGVEVCRRLRSQPEYDNVPIIMFTAKDEVDDKWAGFEAGADDYLTKPTDPEELDRRIQVLLKRIGRGQKTAEDDDTKTTSIVEPPVSDTVNVVRGEELEELFTSPDSSLQTEGSGPTAKLIAVVGARGGVGTTTVAINLAASLAEKKGQTYLLDLDWVQGHVALYLQSKFKGSYINDLSGLTNPLELAREWQQHSISGGDNLHLLLSYPNIVGETPVLTKNQTEVLVDEVVLKTRFVVADIGLGIQPTTIPVLNRAAHIIVCTKPERAALIATKQFVKKLPGFIGPEANVHVLMTKIGIESTLPQPVVEEFIKHKLLATIPISYKELSEAANHNVPLVRLRPASKAAEIFQEIVEHVVV